MIFLFLCVSVLSIISIDVAQGTCVDVPPIPNGFTIHKVIATWEEAQLECQKEGAVLASPVTEELLNKMKSLNGVNNTEYFIGTKANNGDARFVSVEGIQLDNMTSSVMAMVRQIDLRDGKCLSMDRNYIRVVPCNTRLPFMCYTAPIEKEVEDLNAERDCGTEYDGYVYIRGTGSCYKKHTDRRRWDDAKSVCRVEGAHLLVLNNEEEVRAVQTLNLADVDPAFIGLRDYGREGSWKSIDGKPIADVYNKWRFGEPKDPTMKCAGLDLSGVIDNYHCYNRKYFICEKEL